MITEDQLEQLCLDWFHTIGYDYTCGYANARLYITMVLDMMEYIKNY